jgi:O-antigen/teichoic acid export membrane protein
MSVEADVDTLRTDNVGQRSREGVYWNVTLKLLHQGFHFIVVVVLARLLAPDDFGVMALAMAAIAFANQWTNCGIMKVIVQREHLSKEEVNTIFTLNLLLSLSMMAMVAGVASTLASVFRIPALASMVRTLTVIFPLTSYYYVRMALLRRVVSFRLHSAIDFTLGMAQSTTALGLALLGVGVWSLVWGQIVGMCVAIVAIGMVTPWCPRLCWQFARLKPMMRYAGFDMLRSQATYLEEFLSYWIVGYWMTPTILGFFDRANAFSRMPSDRINTQVTTVFFPAFCRVRTDSARLERAFRKSLTAQAMLMSPVLVGLAAVSEYVVPLILGGKWGPIVLPLQILCLAALIRVFATTLQSLNVATHVYGRQALAQALLLPVYAGLCVLSLPWGIVGVSLATLVYTALAFVLYATITLKVLDKGVGILVDCLAPALIGALIMGLVVSVLSHTFLADVTVVNLLLLMAAGAAVYIGWTLWLPHKGVRSVREDILADLISVLRKLGFMGGR